MLQNAILLNNQYFIYWVWQLLCFGSAFRQKRIWYFMLDYPDHKPLANVAFLVPLIIYSCSSRIKYLINCISDGQIKAIFDGKFTDWCLHYLHHNTGCSFSEQWVCTNDLVSFIMTNIDFQSNNLISISSSWVLRLGNSALWFAFNKTVRPYNCMIFVLSSSLSLTETLHIHIHSFSYDFNVVLDVWVSDIFDRL